MKNNGKFQIVWLMLALWLGVTSGQAWWDAKWTGRRKFTVEVKEAGVSAPVSGAAVLVRLHEGNFSFASAKEDGSDLRFVAADDKTLLPFHVERYDSLLGEAFVWVKVPE